MRGGNRVHARVEPGSAYSLCGNTSPYGLTFGDTGFHVDCKNCLALIADENARLRAGVTQQTLSEARLPGAFLSPSH